jgi:RNA polymerase sigma-70 factor (ECF subfamily)
MKALADETLMCKVRDGNLQLLGLLFERYQSPLLNFFLRLTSNRHLSEDLVQDVFFRILRFRHTFRDDTPFTTWMYQIARNVRVDAFRKRKPESEFQEGFESPADAAPSPADLASANQEEAILRQAMQRLSEDQRELLILTRYQNLKYEQVAQLLDCQPGTVKTRVFRAMQELKQLYFELAKCARGPAPGEGRAQEA